MVDFSRDVVWWSFGYVVLLLILGFAGRRAMREKTLSDFYLAGRNIGFFVLLLTLFATQYSGNSMSGFPGQTYRRGLSYIMSVTFMVGIVAGYTLFAPRLFSIARRYRFLTPTDFLNHRFNSRSLNYLSATIFSITLFNFLLAQLMAMGHAFSGLTHGRISFTWGVLGGAAVILIYELLGGMRAVAWTDVLQGSILLGGMLLVVVLLGLEVGTPAAVVRSIHQVSPEKLLISDWKVCAVWISNFLLLGLGGPLYPQAIQRIYAARRLSSLRRALASMALLPLIGTTSVIFVGAVGIMLFPQLDSLQADQVTFKVLAQLVEIQPAAYYPVLVVMMAVIAAVMSTADSCLLSLSSIVRKDFLTPAKKATEAPETPQQLNYLTPLISASVIGLAISLALLQPVTLWELLVLKFELLIQMSPAFVLGTSHDPSDKRGYSSRDILSGLIAGLTTALGLYAVGHRSLYGFHPGTIGVVLNYLTCWGCRAWRLDRENSVAVATA
jgi:Na+/proline symporter